MDPADTRPSGWYPDPANASVQRWWNGISWGDQTRHTNGAPIAPIIATTAPPMIDPYAPAPATEPTTPAAPATRDHQFQRANPIGYAGVVLAAVAILFNVWCVPSILAIIFCAIGIGASQRLRATGRRVTGLGWSVAGVVGGIAETVIYLSNSVK